MIGGRRDIEPNKIIELYVIEGQKHNGFYTRTGTRPVPVEEQGRRGS